jgi:multiple antibiotic resistance protein
MIAMSELSDVMKFGVTLVSILNPIGVLPIFLNFTNRSSDQAVKSMAQSCSIAVFITITVSLFIGQTLLNFFGITIASFTIGGGVLLFSIAFSMVQAQNSDTKINEEEIEFTEASKELGVVPLAIPLLSGPGSISITVIQANTFTHTLHWVGGIFAIFLISLMIFLSLSYSRFIGRKLGPLGLNIMTRIMGIILLAISIEMMARGLKLIFIDFA